MRARDLKSSGSTQILQRCDSDLELDSQRRDAGNLRCHCRNNNSPQHPFARDNMTNKNPIRLPPLRVLRVRHPNRPESNPCLTVMSSVLGMDAVLPAGMAI